MKRVTITIAPDASVKVETAGYVGGECKAVTDAIKRELGSVVEETLKPEYHQATKGVHDVQGY